MNNSEIEITLKNASSRLVDIAYIVAKRYTSDEDLLNEIMATQYSINRCAVHLAKNNEDKSCKEKGEVK